MTAGVTTIESVCGRLAKGRTEDAKEMLRALYPFRPIFPATRAYTPRESMAVFRSDGFVDRYSSARLVFPGTLRVIHRIAPVEFPFQKNWKMTETHIAFWELFPTIDHVRPIARGGLDVPENWVTTSQQRNSAKAHWLLEELGWTLQPRPADTSGWDGLTSWFIEFVAQNPEHLSDSYVARWHRAALGR